MICAMGLIIGFQKHQEGERIRVAIVSMRPDSKIFSFAFLTYIKDMDDDL
jgi:hypothetical protein